MAPGEELESPIFGFGNRCVIQLRQPGKMVPVARFELATYRLSTDGSSAELNRQKNGGKCRNRTCEPFRTPAFQAGALTTQPTSLVDYGGRRLGLNRNRLPGPSAFKTAPGACRVRLPVCWLGREGSNLHSPESKSDALPIKLRPNWKRIVESNHTNGHMKPYSSRN